MDSIVYDGPRAQGFSSKVTMGGTITAASVADPFGLVAMTSKKNGVSISWGEVMLRVEEAAKAGPQFRADLRAMLDRIEEPTAV